MSQQNLHKKFADEVYMFSFVLMYFYETVHYRKASFNIVRAAYLHKTMAYPGI